MASHAMFEGLESRRMLAVFTVTNTSDAGAGSLRQAVLDANAAAGADVIEFASGLVGTITLSGGELGISDSLSINGPGANVLAVSAGNASRVLNFTSGTSLLRGLSITGGNATSGGGVANAGTLTIESSEISSCSAVAGGAIANTGTLTVLNSTIALNTSTSSGAGLFNDAGGVMSVVNCTISDNSTSGQYGGGIDTLGTLTVSNSTFAYNSASNGRAISIRGAGSATAISTIIASSHSGVVYGVFGSGSINNLLQYSGGGLTNGVNGNIIGVDPALEHLGWRGGATRSRPLWNSSPAIDKGVNPNSLTTDQRGGIYARQVGPAVDIGAFEYGGDDHASAGQWADAQEVLLDATERGIHAGVLEQYFDTDLFRIAPTRSGSMRIVCDVARYVDTWFEIYDVSHNLILRQNEWAGDVEAATFVVTGGQTYFILVGGWLSSNGEYIVRFNEDQQGRDQWGGADAIALDSTGHGNRSAEIQDARDTDLFKFSPTNSGTIAITLDVAAGFDGWFELYNADHGYLARQNLRAAGGDEVRTLAVTGGQVYYILVGGWRVPSGDYTIRISDDHADAGEWDNASLITLNSTGDGAGSGAIGSAGDNDLFRFTPSISMTVTVWLDVASDFDGWFELYAPDHSLIARQNGGATNGDESLARSLIGGLTYFILVGGWRNPGGGYSVRIDDDHADANEWLRAGAITLNSAIDGGRAGVIERPGDTDLFRFTRADSGVVTITLDVGPRFDGWFELYNAGHGFLARQNVRAAGGDEARKLGVTAGQVYYILVGGWRVPSGDYTIRISDDHADAGDWSNASAMSINASLDSLGEGKVEATGDTDLFTFTSSVSGALTITLDAASGFDGWFEVYSADHTLLRRQNLWAAGGDETYQLPVTNAQTFFILVGGWRVPTGDYRLLISDDHADAGIWPLATDIALSSTVDGSKTGVIESAGDTDLFRFTAVATASATFTLDAGDGFDGWFEVYDASQMLLLRKNLWGSGTDESGSVALTAGLVYYVLVGGWRVPDGHYTLLISDDHADELAWSSATALTPNEDGHAGAPGLIESADDTDLFLYTPAATDAVTITLDAVRGFDGWFEIYNADYTLIRRVNTTGAGGDEVWGFHLTQGQSYFVLVGGTLAPNGRYTLNLND